jgi:transposase
MEVLYTVCCGLDVHKASVTACLRVPGDRGDRRQEVRTFGTTTGELLRLVDWLRAAGCTHVALESTGIYWRPVYNLLEDHCELFLVNAQHVKMVPGRKSDVRDSEWLAQLLELGLLRRSFVPPAAQRELRDMVRYRTRLIESRTQQANRLQKVLETANIKLGSVATEILGVSARAMIKALIAGAQTPDQVADLAKRSLRRKRAALAEALTGRVTAHHRFLLDQLLRHIEFLDAAIAACDREIVTRTATQADALTRLDTIPGVARRTAEVIVAELGDDMTRFPTAGHAASWTGLCPGTNESAGKRRNGRTRRANRTLRAALVESARAAVCKRDCYLAAQYRRLVKRRGDKKAIVAVAHSILVITYHILRDGQSYRELGGDYFDRLSIDRLTRYHTKRLTALGYIVTLTKAAA